MLAKALQGATAAADKLYIEDVMSTYLYTGNGSTQTITNGIDLSGEGGLVWIKSRLSSIRDHRLFDTARGINNFLASNTTDQQQTSGGSLTAFNSSGFDIGAAGAINTSADTYASWTFRKAAKFFDVVTYAGDGTADRALSHSLGSTPGAVIIKRTDNTSDWVVWHRSLTLANTAQGLRLNGTDAFGSQSGNTVWGSTSPMSSTTLRVGASGAGNWNTNIDGATYVAYLFAHDAGGFGDAGTDSVVKCGSFTKTASWPDSAPVVLGWEPQFLLYKRSDSGSVNWNIGDIMRGDGNVSGTGAGLSPNLSNAETTTLQFSATPTGFTIGNASSIGGNYIYIAIRRGPMKTPTDATKVFSANAFTSSANGVTTTGFPPDLVLYANRDRTAFSNSRIADRLRGAITSGSGQTLDLMTESTSGEGAVISNIVSTDNVSFKWQSGTTGYSIVSESFRRAPGFFDVVAYTGTGANQQVTHNLGVVPEMMIIKSRSGAFGWAVYHSGMGTDLIELQSNIYGSSANPNWWDNGAPTSTLIKTPTGSNAAANRSGDTFVAYLFSSCPGVSKVGSYTGTATTLSIDCGFTNGARFVLIRRKDAGGDWYVWDTARGIVSGNDPYLLLNSTAAEVTGTDYIDPLSSGFQISSTAPAAINANGGSYIYLSVA